jgi:segregation and condensation protein B
MQDEARRALEAVIMVADQPADPALLAQLVELSPEAVEELLVELAATYEEQGRGFQLAKVAGGWRFQSHEDLSPYVERYVLTGQTARLSAAALETLAIVAYKQPISRAQVAAIRGVGVDGVMRTLQQRGYIDEIAKDPGPGQASLFGTTALFLERLGMNSLDELPSLGDFIPGADVVELLEQGLRVDPDDEPVAAASDDGAPLDGPLVAVDLGDQPVIDLDAGDD